MNRLKLFLLILIIAAAAIIFVQNREPVALKLLCDDVNSQYCFYQTPKLPVAIWISLFVVGGILTNLLGQVFSRYSYSSSGKKKYTQDNLSSKPKNWVDQDSEPSRYSTSSTKSDDSVILDQSNESTSTSYEAVQKPQSVERSGSNYSYKYRTQDKTKNNENKIESKSIDLNKDIHVDSDRDDEDWI